MKNISILILVILVNRGFTQEKLSNENILFELNIEYSKYSNEEGKVEPLLLDLYQPKMKELKKRPVIVFVHGGGFARGDKQQELYKKMAKVFANKGYVALSVNYTLMKKNEKYEPYVLNRDVKQILEAVEWIKIHQKKYNVDMRKVFICGDSAGGAIVVNASLNCDGNFQFAGCIDLWGGLPGGKRWGGPIFPYELMDCVPPICIIHGTNDSVVPFETSNELAKKYKALKKYNELHKLKNAEHYPEELSDVFIPIMLSFSQKIIDDRL